MREATPTPIPENQHLIQAYVIVQRSYNYDDAFEFDSYHDAQVRQYLLHATPLPAQTVAYVKNTVLPALNVQLGIVDTKLTRALEQENERRTSRYGDLSGRFSTLLNRLETGVA